MEIARSPATSSRVSPLLRLPVELRLQIYAYLLSYQTDTSRLSSISTSRKTSAKSLNASILLVNRQLNDEATPFLYSQNTFLAHPSLLTSFPRLRSFLPPITEPSVLCLIRRIHLTMRLDCGPAFDADTACRTLSGLEELTIELAQGYFLGAGCQNLTALEGVRSVTRLRFCGSTIGFETYLAWLREVMMSRPGDQIQKFRPIEDCLWVDKFTKCNNLIVV
ncbi:hypothetical protein CC79DRAFT_1364501 [Sarocladium strictum]